jgi:hypothetical protein
MNSILKSGKRAWLGISNSRSTPKVDRKEAMVPFSESISSRYPELITISGGFAGVAT